MPSPVVWWAVMKDGRVVRYCDTYAEALIERVKLGAQDVVRWEIP